MISNYLLYQCWSEAVGTPKPKPKHLALTVKLNVLFTSVQIPGELSISSWGSYAPVAMERKLGEAPSSVVCHLTDRDIVAHKDPVMTFTPKSDKS
jgi:hypothetical protein